MGGYLALLQFAAIDEIGEKIGCLKYDIIRWGCTGTGDMTQEHLHRNILENHIDALGGFRHIPKDAEDLFLNVDRTVS